LVITKRYTNALYFTIAFRVLALLVGRQEEQPACKMSDEMLAWLSILSEAQMICVWFS